MNYFHGGGIESLVKVQCHFDGTSVKRTSIPVVVS